MWKRKTEKEVSDVEDEAKTVEKTAINGNAVPANRVHWRCFVETLCSDVKLQEMT